MTIAANSVNERKDHRAGSYLSELLELLPNELSQHPPSSPGYINLSEKLKHEVDNVFSPGQNAPVKLAELPAITFPFFKMGAISSLDLWNLDELILFSFYYRNRDRYKKALDIGANIGLHSIIMSRCGYSVTAFEPDPTHYAVLTKNLALNNCKNVKAERAAISDKDSIQNFVRVIGNTTSSHLEGSKEGVYGPTETFSVRTVDISAIVKDVDFIKIDAEGHELQIILCIPQQAYDHLDIVLEIGTKKNAEAIYNKLKDTNINLFAQKNGWEKVASLDDMPTSYRDGSLFISSKDQMPW